MENTTCTGAADRRLFLVSSVVLAATFYLSGCATSPAAQDFEQAKLLKRASEYWERVKANDNVAAWPYEAVAKDPQNTIESYLKRGGIVYDAVEVKRVRSLEGDTAILDVWMRYSVPMARIKGLEGEVQDEWKRIDGMWHHVLRRGVMFPASKS